MFFVTTGQRWHNRCVGWLFTVLFVVLFGCASVPKETYRGYTGDELPDASLALLYMGDGGTVKIDGMYYVESYKYSAVKLLPGPHRIEWTSTFGVSVMVDPRMIVGFGNKETVTLQAGHSYRLRADRTTGPGYRVYMWIEDTLNGNVVAGEKKP
jgi:hypothetical protein